MSSNPTSRTNIYGMKLKVAVFVNHPQCSVQSAHGIVRTLQDYSIDCIGRQHLRDKVLKKYDLLCIPGGLGDSDTWHSIMEPFADSITNFVASGRRYLGICMGAYWAGPYYFNLLQNIEPVQYIKRADAEVRRSFGTVVDIDWSGQTETVYFYDGCCFIGKGPRQVLATYSNGEPAAIIQDNLGLIGPHLESDIYWYSKPYMKPYWHDYRHHDLLKKFVDQLFAN